MRQCAAVTYQMHAQAGSAPSPHDFEPWRPLHVGPDRGLRRNGS